MLSIISAIAGVIPVFGPIVQGVVDGWNKHEDIGLKKQIDQNQTILEKSKDENKTDLAIINTRAQLAIAMKDDPGTKVARDFLMFPVAINTALVYWCVTFPQYSWGAHAPDGVLAYLAYAVIAYLFVTAWKGKP